MESATKLIKSYDKEERKAILSNLQAFFKANNISNSRITIKSSLDVNEYEPILIKRKNIRCTIRLPRKEKGQKDELREKLKEDSDLLRGIDIKIELDTVVGSQFVPIEGSKRLGTEVSENSSFSFCLSRGGKDEKNQIISHTKGTVLLVEFWATWCKSSKYSMAHNQKMLEKNEDKWKGKVRIVGASLDQDKAKVLERIEEKGWNNIDHYILPSSWEHLDLKTYNCTDIPHFVLVDKIGKISYTGSDDTKFEEKINTLLAEENEKEDSSNKGEKAEKPAVITEKGVPAEIYKKLKSLIKNGEFRTITELKRQKGFYYISLELEHTKEFDSNLKLIAVDRQKLMIDGSLSSSAAETLKKTLADILKEIPMQYIQQEFETLTTVKIEFGTSCDSCSKPLMNKDAQYLSYQDKKYFCKACGEKEDNTKHGVEKYVNPHALIYLNFKNPSAVEEARESRIGDQDQPKTKEEEAKMKVHRDGYCNGCHQNLKTRIRFKCLTCADFNICRVCHEKIEAGHRGIAEKLKGRSHDVNSHIVQRYCFTKSDGRLKQLGFQREEDEDL